MCAVFGLIDYKCVFTAKQRERILRVLSIECEVRGVDATGFAFNSGGKLKIFKRPFPAHEMRLKLTDDVNIILGHTRMTTQGNSQHNFNNHPFFGNAGIKFVLAHNGMLRNENFIRHELSIPESHIQTDSYIAVQILEKLGALNEKTLAEMAEKVSGEFVFTLLDEDNNFYFIKGNNPLALYHFEAGFYIYASTDMILEYALDELRLDEHPYQEIENHAGDIIRIDSNGNLTRYSFVPDVQYFDDTYSLCDVFTYRNLTQYADQCGVDWRYIGELLSYGYSPDEIEDLLCVPGGIEMAVQEILGEYDWYGEW